MELTKQELNHIYYANNKEKIRLAQKRYYNEHKTELLERQRPYSRKHDLELKIAALSYYSNGKLMCVRCGFQDIRALSIDHINGNGNQHRKGVGNGAHIYWWLKAHDYPEGFQTLCMNCQWIKRQENGE